MLVSILSIDDQDRSRLRAVLAGAIVEAGAYIVADVDEARAKELQAQGFLIGRQDGPDRADAGADAEPAIAVFADGGAALEENSADGEGDFEGDARAIILLKGPLNSERMEWLADRGIRLKRKIGSGDYLCDRPFAEVAGKVQGAEWLGVAPYGRLETLGTDLARDARAKILKSGPTPARATFESAEDEVVPLDDTSGQSDGLAFYDLRCTSVDEQQQVVSMLQSDPRVSNVEAGHNRIRIGVTAGSADAATLLEDLGRISSVLVVEVYVQPELLLDYAVAGLLGQHEPQPGLGLPWSGKGEVIAVADTGVDALHPDLAGRVDCVELVPPASPRDPLGHGTHVASLAAGNGSASNGKLRSPAWEARLFVLSMADQNLTMRFGVGLHEMLQQAYDAGARVINLSWGGAVKGRYTLDADDIDKFVYNHPDVLIVIAAGNAGAQDMAFGKGRTGLRSLASPATAKNVLTVGATCSPRLDGPYAGLTWNQYDGTQPPQQPPLSKLSLTGDADVVAALSARGPSDDGRIKPDLVVPGVGIAGALSADYGNPRHPFPEQPGYHFMTGTSMSAPIAASAAAVLRQYYREVHTHAPSAALLRATMVNGCEWIAADPFVDERIGEPNFHQGFGRLNLLSAIPASVDAGFATKFVDVPNDGNGALKAEVSTLAIARHKVLVKAGELRPMSVTMAWTDPPGRQIQHDLDLILIAPDGTRIVGNSGLRRAEFEDFDKTNNVEQARVKEAMPGDWIVMVTAKNTFRGGQGYALAITGNF